MVGQVHLIIQFLIRIIIRRIELFANRRFDAIVRYLNKEGILLLHHYLADDEFLVIIPIVERVSGFILGTLRIL